MVSLQCQRLGKNRTSLCHSISLPPNKQTTRTKDFTLNVKLQEQVNYLCTTQEETFGEGEPKDSSYTSKILKIERKDLPAPLITQKTCIEIAGLQKRWTLGLPVQRLHLVIADPGVHFPDPYPEELHPTSPSSHWRDHSAAQLGSWPWPKTMLWLRMLNWLWRVFLLLPNCSTKMCLVLP